MCMTVNELQEKRRIAWEAAKDFLETHRMDNGLIPAVDVRTYEKMEQDIQNYSEEIARLERLQKLDDAMRRPTSEPLTRRPGKSAAGRASDEYRSAMLTALRSNFKDVSNILREGQDESGGYLDPAIYAQQNDELIKQSEQLTAQKNAITARVSGGDKQKKALEDILHFTARAEMQTVFDEALFTRFVHNVIVCSRTEIGFAMKCGPVFRERI